MKAGNLYFTDLVGRKARVIQCTNANNVGIEGTVCDETMKTLHIQTETGVKIIPKRGTVFSFIHEGEEVKIRGDAIIFRPEDRIKQHSRIEKNLKRSG